jgi:outer membrane protein TolC
MRSAFPFVALLVTSQAFATAPLAPPAPIELSDPMLAPVPAPPKAVATWEEALDLIRSLSTDLRTALEAVERAEAQTRVALGAMLPTLTANGTIVRNFITNDIPRLTGSATNPVVSVQTSPTPTYANGSIVFVQPVLALQAWHTRATTRRVVDAARLSVDDVKRNLALGAANAIVGVITAERIAELNRIGLRRALETRELTARKLALGGANGLDVVRAAQDVESARATLVTGDESLRQARESLGLVLGLPTQVGVVPGIRIDGLEASAARVCQPAASVDQRSDIAAQKKQVEVARRNVDNVWLRFAPTINLQSTLGTTSLDVAPSPATTWNVQGVLSVPLWEGGARYGLLRDARGAEAQAEQQLEALRRAAIVQITQARRTVEVAESSRRVATTARELAEQADRLTQVSFREGRGTSLELVLTAAALRQAEVNLALREFDLVRARIAAVLALATCPW